MSAAGLNTPDDRDFNAGYKHDAGWIPDARVATISSDGFTAAVAGGGSPSSSSSMSTGELRGGIIMTTVAAIDSGSLTRGSGSGSGSGSDLPPLTVRLRHPASRTDTGERWWYASFRSQSQSSPRGVTINDVPLDSGTAGNSRLWDSTGVTPSQADAGLSVGAAVVLPSVSSSEFLWEAVGYSRSPAASTSPQDGRLSLRISKLDPVTRLPPAGLGCWGVACAPAPTATPVSLNCGVNPAAAVALPVPVTELGYPAVFAVSDGSLQATAPSLASAGVSAMLCLPAATAVGGVNVSLAGYDAFPSAEALTTSPLTRGNAFYSASPFNASCATLSFALPAGGSRFVAAAATTPRAGVMPWTSAASAPAPLTLTLSCIAPVAGTSPTPLGPVLPIFSAACVYLDFGGSSSGQFDGTYCRNTAVGLVNGAWQYDDSDRRYQLTWLGGSWYLWVWGSRSSYYFTQSVSAIAGRRAYGPSLCSVDAAAISASRCPLQQPAQLKPSLPVGFLHACFFADTSLLSFAASPLITAPVCTLALLCCALPLCLCRTSPRLICRCSRRLARYRSPPRACAPQDRSSTPAQQGLEAAAAASHVLVARLSAGASQGRLSTISPLHAHARLATLPSSMLPTTGRHAHRVRPVRLRRLQATLCPAVLRARQASPALQAPRRVSLLPRMLVLAWARAVQPRMRTRRVRAA